MVLCADLTQKKRKKEVIETPTTGSEHTESSESTSMGEVSPDLPSASDFSVNSLDIHLADGMLDSLKTTTQSQSCS